jgi:colicin import membrane protein
MDSQKRFLWPLILALALHFTLLGLFVLSALYKPKVMEPEPVPEIIHATMIDTASLQAEAEAAKRAKAAKMQAEKDRREAVEAKEKAEIEAKRVELEKAKKEAEAAEQAKAETARQAKAEAAAKAKAEAAAKAKEEAAAQAKAEAARQAKAEAAAKAKAEAAAKAKEEAAAQAKAEAARQAKAEAAKAKAAAQGDELKKAMKAIQDKTNRSWIRPVSATAGLKCTIRVRLMSDGTVIDAEVISSSGDEIFDRSAENAVNKASPLPVPKDKELFAREFRSFQFLFNPK